MDFNLYNFEESSESSSSTEKQNNEKVKEGEKVLDLLIEIPLIKELTFTVIKQISHEFIKQYYKKSEYVIRQGDPINDIYLILKGSFVITLNHYIEYDVEPDIDTFMKYQSITGEPFNTDRNYEIKGKINKTEEIELFIYQKKYFFGDIEISSNKKYSLFNIRANEDNSIVCTMERKKWCGIIRKIREKFNKYTSNKIDIIQERIKDILLKKKKLKFDKLKLSQEKIYYQLVVNNNYNICNQKLNNLNNNEFNIKKNKIIKKKNYIKKNIHINNNINNISTNEEKNKQVLSKSKSLLNLKSYQKRVMDLFKFPVILKHETKENFKKFFDNFYIKRDKKKVKLTETKIDSEPIYINRFRGIYNMTPQQKFEFLNNVKNYLENNYKKSEYLTPKLKKKKSNIQELFTMYNFYINNTHENTNSTNFSKPNIMYRTSNMLNTSLKSNLRRNNIINNSLSRNLRKNTSFTPKEINNSLKIDSRKNLNFGNLKNIHYAGDKNRIRLKKIKFSNHIMNFVKKNMDLGNNFEKNVNFKNFGNNKNNIINLDENLILSRNKKRMTANNSVNKKLFKNEKITTKTIFEVLLKNKCEDVKSQILENIGGEKVKDNLCYKININNNIDVRNEDYIKNLFYGNKFSRSKSFNDDKFN